MDRKMDWEAEGYGLIRWMLTTLAVANGLGVLAIATAATNDKTPDWISLLLVPSACLFTLGILCAGMATTALAMFYMERHDGLPKEAAKLLMPIYLSGFLSHAALISGIGWPLIHVVAKASSGSF